MAPEELAMTMEAGAPVESIYKTVYQGEGTEITLADRLEEKENRQEKLLEQGLCWKRFWENLKRMKEG